MWGSSFACQSGERAPAASPNAPPTSSSDRDSASCPAPPTVKASVEDPGNFVGVMFSYPAPWKAVQPSPNSLTLSLEGSGLQVIVSVNAGGTLQESDVRELHKKTIVPLCQKTTDLKKRADANDLLDLE